MTATTLYTVSFTELSLLPKATEQLAWYNQSTANTPLQNYTLKSIEVCSYAIMSKKHYNEWKEIFTNEFLTKGMFVDFFEECGEYETSPQDPDFVLFNIMWELGDGNVFVFVGSKGSCDVCYDFDFFCRKNNIDCQSESSNDSICLNENIILKPQSEVDYMDMDYENVMLISPDDNAQLIEFWKKFQHAVN